MTADESAPVARGPAGTPASDPADAAERLRRVFVSPSDSVGTAMRRMDESARRIVFVVDDRGALLGVATDGDLRRWILAGRSLDDSVQRAMNSAPVTVGETYSPEEVERLLVERRIECIPILDDQGRVVDAVWWLDLFETHPAERRHVDLPVVIMAGGRGSRLGPYTHVLPKPLVPVGETPIIELIMDRFAEAGVSRFFVSVNYKANLIRAYFADVEHDYSVEFVEEGRPLGTGGSLSLLRESLGGTFILTNCDILVEADYADIVDVHRQSGNLVTIVASLKHYTVPYGVLDVADGGALAAITEKPHFDFLVNTGLYVVEPEVLSEIPEDTFRHVTDIVNDYLEQGRKVGVYPVSERSWTDVGQLEGLHDTLERLSEG